MKRLFILLFAVLPLILTAQVRKHVNAEPAADSLPAVRFGYLSYDVALKAMPEYVKAQEVIGKQRTAYETEVKRVEDDFNAKYEAFLEGQSEFPRTILLKRQNELKELMQHNLEFKAQARQELQKAETEALKPIRAKLNETLGVVAREYGLSLIINTDSNACPYIDPVMGKDVQDLVVEYLSKK
jgi:outer membrane protein